jgi:hypothetical protein
MRTMPQFDRHYQWIVSAISYSSPSPIKVFRTIRYRLAGYFSVKRGIGLPQVLIFKSGSHEPAPVTNRSKMNAEGPGVFLE